MRATDGGRFRERVRPILLVAGLFSGLVLKGISHLLIALDVSGARQLLHVAHVVIALIAVAILVRTAYKLLIPRARRRRAHSALTASLAQAGDSEDATEVTVAPLVTSGLVRCAVTGVVAGATTRTRAFGGMDEGGVTSPEGVVFEIGSLTKVFTGVLLAEMAEAGEVSLDDRLGRILPTLEAGGAGAITLLDLATHHSGLPRLPRSMVRSLLRSALLTHEAPADPYQGTTPEDLEGELAKASPRSPGSGYRYSNFGFAVLGQALARVAETPYERLVEERICRPLGLAETVFSPQEALGARQAEGHDRLGKRTAAWHTGAFAPAAGLHSTVADMLRFAQAALDPHSTPLATAMASAQEPCRATGDRLGSQVGLGWQIRPTEAGHAVWHNGGTGGFGCFLAIDGGRSAAVTILTNAAHDPVVDAAGFELLGRLR